MHVRFPPQLEQQCHASLREDLGICGFLSRLSHQAFQRGFPTGLSHVAPFSESILGLKIEVGQGKQVSLEWTENSGGLCWRSSRLSCGERLLFRSDGNAGNS